MNFTHPVLDELRQRAANVKQRYGDIVRALATNQPLAPDEVEAILHAASKTEDDLLMDAHSHKEALDLLNELQEAQVIVREAGPTIGKLERLQADWTARRNALDAEYEPQIVELQRKTSADSQQRGRIDEAIRKLSTLPRPLGWVDGETEIRFAGERRLAPQ